MPCSERTSGSAALGLCTEQLLLLSLTLASLVQLAALSELFLNARKSTRVLRCLGSYAGVIHAKRMKSFLRFLQTGKSRSQRQQPADDGSEDAEYQKALGHVNTVKHLPPDLVGSPLTGCRVQARRLNFHAPEVLQTCISPAASHHWKDSFRRCQG